MDYKDEESSSLSENNEIINDYQVLVTMIERLEKKFDEHIATTHSLLQEVIKTQLSKTKKVETPEVNNNTSSSSSLFFIITQLISPSENEDVSEFEVSGRTFDYRDFFKDLGAQFNPKTKGWRIKMEWYDEVLNYLKNITTQIRYKKLPWISLTETN